LAAHLDKDAEELFTLTGQSFDAYHRLFGIRYPFGEYHQAFVPEFNAGAMENPGCVTFRDDLVFRSKVTDGERGMRARTIVHEMAHQWFGDLVTMRWWDDLWLNESFAEYMAYRVTDSDTGFRDSWVDFAYVRKRWGMLADQRPSTHPVAGNGVPDAASALTDFDGISYAKGAAALKQLNAYLGDEVFLDGVRAHLRGHAYGNATLGDLLQAWTDAGASDLGGWAEQWLQTPGIDILRTETAEGRTLLRRTTPEQFPADRPHQFTVTTYGASGAIGGCANLTVTQALTPLPFEVAAGDAPSVTVIDSGDDTWAKTRIDLRGMAALPAVLPQILDPVARAAVWNSLRDALGDAELDPSDYLGLLESALPAEDEDIAVSALLGGAHRLLGRYLPVRRYADRLTGVARECLERAPAGSARQVAAARAFATATTDEAVLLGWLSGQAIPPGLSIDTEMRWSIELRLAILGAADGDHIDAELAIDPSAEGAIHALRCRAARPNQDAKAAAWKVITTDPAVTNYELYALCEGFWQPEQVELSAPYVERYFTEVPATASLRSGWLAQAACALAFPMFAVEARTLAMAEETLRGDQLTAGARRSIVDCADDLRRALAVRERFG
jgi:aminopeptidase N